MKIGVLGLQGAIEEHIAQVEEMGEVAQRVTTSEELWSCDGLILPGGESTSMRKLIDDYHLFEELKEYTKKRAVLGTCAGMILLSKEHLNVLDVEVERNGFGRQIESYEEVIEIKGISKAFDAVFIRAPYIKEAEKKVKILSKSRNQIVAVEQKNILAFAFHPELSEDTSVIESFLKKVKKYKK